MFYVPPVYGTCRYLTSLVSTELSHRKIDISRVYSSGRRCARSHRADSHSQGNLPHPGLLQKREMAPDLVPCCPHGIGLASYSDLKSHGMHRRLYSQDLGMVGKQGLQGTGTLGFSQSSRGHRGQQPTPNNASPPAGTQMKSKMVQHHLLTSVSLATSAQGLCSPKPIGRTSG